MTVHIVKRTTESTNVALATCASGGTQVGSNLDVFIPTNGIIRVTMAEAQLSRVSGSVTYAAFGLGINVNNLPYWAYSQIYTGANFYAPGTLVNDTNNAIISGSWINTTANSLSGVSPVSITYDISDRGIDTGSQTLKIIMGDKAVATSNGQDEGQLDGATKTAAFIVEIIDTD